MQASRIMAPGEGAGAEDDQDGADTLDGRVDEVPPNQLGAFLVLLTETTTRQTSIRSRAQDPGVGKLVNAQRAAGIGPNPATGETNKIRANTTVKCWLAKAAKHVMVLSQT